MTLLSLCMKIILLFQKSRRRPCTSIGQPLVLSCLPPVASSYARRRMYLQVIHTFIYADVTLDENVITVMRSWISQSADLKQKSK